MPHFLSNRPSRHDRRHLFQDLRRQDGALEGTGDIALPPDTFTTLTSTIQVAPTGDGLVSASVSDTTTFVVETFTLTSPVPEDTTFTPIPSFEPTFEPSTLPSAVFSSFVPDEAILIETIPVVFTSEGSSGLLAPSPESQSPTTSGSVASQPTISDTAMSSMSLGSSVLASSPSDAPATSSESAASESPARPLPDGVILGIVVALAVLFVGGIVFWILRMRRRNKGPFDEESFAPRFWWRRRRLSFADPTLRSPRQTPPKISFWSARLLQVL